MGAQLSLASYAPQLPELLPALSQWHTPTWLARRMVAWADLLPGARVLEPSAGGGAIVAEIPLGVDVTAVEIDPRWLPVLRERCPEAGVIASDFLALYPAVRFDVAVMNPPLDGGVGVQHVAHALQFAPRVVSLLRAGDLHGKARRSFWQSVRLDGVAWCSERPVFGGDGGQTEFVVVDVRRPGAGQVWPRLEWWTSAEE